MNKVELAKMLGLASDEELYLGCMLNSWEVRSVVGECGFIRKSFMKGKIEIDIDEEDYSPEGLDIKSDDLVEDGDIKVCIKQVEDLIWERAADEYLLRIKRAALLVGGE